MDDEELTSSLEELGDCLEDMARAVDRMKTVTKRMFRSIQDLQRKQRGIVERLERLENGAAHEEAP